MQFNQPISFKKKQSIGFLEQLSQQSLLLKIISYLIFFTFSIVIDIALLFSHKEYFQYIMAKLASNLGILIIISLYNRRLKNYYLSFFIFTSKVISLLLLTLLGEDYQLIMVFILEENQIFTESWENFSQRFLIKIGCLTLTIVKTNSFDFVIMICVLLFEILKYIYLISVNKKIFAQRLEQNQQLFPIYTKENSWMNSISTLQQFYITISRNTLQIKHKNLNFFNHFSILCSCNNEELDELILKKFCFTIIQGKLSKYLENQEAKRNQQNSAKQYLNEIPHHQINNDLSTENINWIQKENSSLIEILENYKQMKNQRSSERKIQILEFYCQHFWGDNKFSTFTGQIIINSEQDEIILILIDITKENKFQEERIKDQFKISVVQSFSHELRTPLNSSLNFLQYCENDSSISENIKNNFISPAVNALRLQSYLINDIIDFSSLQADNFELNIQNVTVEQIVDEVNKLFKPIVKMKNLVLFVDLTKNELKSIRTDFTRLIQVLTNLLQNSTKYSSSGLIVLKLTSLQQNCIKVSVKDEGLGIDIERLKQIQRMLSDVEGRRKSSIFSQWQGFGLLISSMLLQKLKPNDQKSLYVNSKGKGKGTKIVFYIKNHMLISLSPQLEQHIKNKYGQHLQAASSHSVSINGSLIQISDLDLFKQTWKQSPQNQKKIKLPYQGDNSALSNSLADIDFELQIGEFQNFHPFLFSEHSNQLKTLQLTNYPPKVLNYQKIKLKEEQENEKQLKNFFRKMNCTCRKVLSIDDEIFNQKSIQFLLNQYGFEVVLAFNGEEAIRIVSQSQKCSVNCCLFLLILMDYQMPIMNGLRATSVLKQMMMQNQIPQISIIGLTAFSSKNDIELCLESGMNAILTKPLKIAELLEIIKQL